MNKSVLVILPVAAVLALSSLYGLNHYRQVRSDRAFELRLSQEREITAAAAKGPGAVEETRTRIDAYNRAVSEGLDVEKTEAQAMQELEAKRQANGQAVLEQIRRDTEQTERINAAEAAAGSDPVARGAARLKAEMQNDYQNSTAGDASK